MDVDAAFRDIVSINCSRTCTSLQSNFLVLMVRTE
jgi:hypothetical protein